MPDARHKKLNIPSIKNFNPSSIIRVVLGILVVIAYTIFLSPTIENKLTSIISENIRNNSETTINTLSPIFDIHVYAGDYNLSSQILKNSSSSATEFKTIDPRILAMNKFLTDYHSPLAPYATDLISSADKYGLDWRLVASISGVESAFGNIIPTDSHNAWGWRGINKNSAGWSIFVSWTDGIEEVSKGLANGYGTNLTPSEIEPSYCPPCASNGQHLWANGVKQYMDELDYYTENLDNL